MKNVWLVGATALALVSRAMAAEAVDIVNEDDNAYDILMETDGAKYKIEMYPGEYLTGVCGRCTFSFEDGNSVEAEDDQVLVIKDGKLKLKYKVN